MQELTELERAERKRERAKARSRRPPTPAASGASFRVANPKQVQATIAIAIMNRSAGDVVWRAGILKEAYSKAEIEEYNRDQAEEYNNELPPDIARTEWRSMSEVLFDMQDRWDISRSTLLTLVTKPTELMTYRMADRLLSHLNDGEQKRLRKALFAPDIKSARQSYLDSLRKATRSLALGILATVVQTPAQVRAFIRQLPGQHVLVSIPDETAIPRNGYGRLVGEQGRFVKRARRVGADDARLALASLRVFSMFDAFPLMRELNPGELNSLARRCFNAELALIRAESRQYGWIAGENTGSDGKVLFEIAPDQASDTARAAASTPVTQPSTMVVKTPAKKKYRPSSDHQRAKTKRDRKDAAMLAAAKQAFERSDRLSKDRKKRKKR